MIDGFGALFSSFMLGVVLVGFQPQIGLTTNNLFGLAIVPLFFTVFSFLAAKKIFPNTKLALRIIACANLSYCLLTSFVVFQSSLLVLGCLYFIGEIILITTLAIWELRIAGRLGEKRFQSTIN